MCATSSNRTGVSGNFRSLRNRRGFSLLELLIAVTLLALLTAALYGSFFSVVRARERASEGMEERRELGATLDLLRREISSLQFSTSDKRLRFVVEDRDNFGKPASTLEFTTIAPPWEHQTVRGSGVRAVRYEMVEKDGRFRLMRKEQDLFYDWQKGASYPQMERISAFLVECSDGSKWFRSWDTAASLNGKPPRQVRITVQFQEQGTPQEFYVLATPRGGG